jgi:hypothetical protein
VRGAVVRVSVVMGAMVRVSVVRGAVVRVSVVRGAVVRVSVVRGAVVRMSVVRELVSAIRDSIVQHHTPHTHTTVTRQSHDSHTTATGNHVRTSQFDTEVCCLENPPNHIASIP